MAAFKDKKNGSWYVQFRYTDWRGERQQKLKRRFATKKEAQAWEREFLMQKQADISRSRHGWQNSQSRTASRNSRQRRSASRSKKFRISRSMWRLSKRLRRGPFHCPPR